MTASLSLEVSDLGSGIFKHLVTIKCKIWCICQVNVYTIHVESFWAPWKPQCMKVLTWSLAYHWCTIVGCKSLSNVIGQCIHKELALINVHNQNQPLANKNHPQSYFVYDQHWSTQSLAEPCCWETPKPAPNLRRKPFNKEWRVGGHEAHP